jgi:hypothetical protein
VSRRLTGESIASLLATPWRYLPIIVLLAATLGWAGYDSAALTRSLQDSKRMQIADGRFIAVVTVHGTAAAASTLGQGGGIPGARCDALATFPGIRQAGLLVPAGTAVLRSEPDGGIPLWTISPGLARLLGMDSGRDVLVGSEAATELGMRTGSRLSFTYPAYPGSVVVGVYAAQRDRTAALDRAVLVVAPPRALRGACLVEIIGTSPNSAAVFLGALLGVQVDVRPLADVNRLGADPGYAFAHRTQRLVAPIAPALAVLAWVLLLRTRRSELALQRIFGLPRILLTKALLGEFAICLLVALVPAIACIAGAARHDRIAALAGLAATAQGYAVVVCLAVPATFLLSVRHGGELRALRSAE